MELHALPRRTVSVVVALRTLQLHPQKQPCGLGRSVAGALGARLLVESRGDEKSAAVLRLAGPHLAVLASVVRQSRLGRQHVTNNRVPSAAVAKLLRQPLLLQRREPL